MFHDVHAQGCAQQWDLTDDQQTALRQAFWGFDRDDTQLPERALAEVQCQRRILGVAETDTKMTLVWRRQQANLQPLLRHAVHLNRFFDQHHLRIFQLVPQGRQSLRHVCIDVVGLYAILREVSWACRTLCIAVVLR